MFTTRPSIFPVFFFFNDTATTEIYTLSLHDALPISNMEEGAEVGASRCESIQRGSDSRADRKSTRLNSSHGYISYAVFCLKKKKNKTRPLTCPDKQGVSERVKQRTSRGEYIRPRTLI